MSLVSWGGISMPLLGGGLQLRDLRRQNLALGGKILGNYSPGKYTDARKLFGKKNSGARLRCLDYPPMCRKGSPIFSICLKSPSLLKTNIHWIPGNGKHINIWDDPIMGMKPIG